MQGDFVTDQCWQLKIVYAVKSRESIEVRTKSE
jgi:hypothetical protein